MPLHALHPLRHRATAIPVVDEDGRLVGVVGASTLMDILRREHVQDLLSLLIYFGCVTAVVL
jgi:Mg/Co/Ni transporter MgtE